jgi:sugar phosphate isomerase/epimerase
MTIREFIEFGAALGLDAVEPTSYYIYQTDKPYLHGLKALAFRKGIEISGTAVGNNFCAPEGKALDHQLSEFRKWVDAAVELGAPHIRVFAGRKAEDADRQRDFARAVTTMKRAVEYAASRGVFLGIENHGYLTEAADDVLRFLDAVPSPWLGVNLDTGNFDDDGYAQIAKLAPKAVNCQLKTDIPDGGRKQPVDIGRVFAILRRADYHGYVALEYEGKDEPKTAVPRYVKQMQALAGSVA